MKNIDLEDLPDSKQISAEIKRVRHNKTYLRILKSTVSSLIVVSAAAVLASVLFLPVLRVTGTSMQPTLNNDELVMCLKRSSFKSGDIVAFYYNNKILLKRVIGTSGDYINIDEDGTVYVNDAPFDEPYLEEKGLGECNIEFPYQVPEQKIFVMGDNRLTSIDSRNTVVGCISEEAVLGKVFLRVWPWEKIGTDLY